MRRFVTAVAAIALAAGAAHAKGDDKGGGHGGGHGGADAGASMQAGGHGKGHDAGGQAEGGGSKDHGSARAEHGNSGDHGNARFVPDDQLRATARHDRAEHGNGHGNAERTVVIDRRGGDRTVVFDDRGRGHGDIARVASFGAIPVRGLVAGCPPGLAKKHPPCVPPGHARPRVVRYDRPDFWGLRLDGGRYRYNDGYLVRLAPDGRIGGYVPLLGGALALGNLWPASYQPVALPTYYETYYDLGPYQSYRYADNVIYRIDPETAAISSIAALLTGDDFEVGQPMPVGYDVYNVPYAYRAQYSDRPDALYRYSDGYVYQIDPKTRLIAAAVELLVS